MKAVARLAVCAFLLLPLYSLQRQPYSLSVDVDLIVLNVRVLDKNRQSVHGLSKENFVVEDDGKRQDISFSSDKRVRLRSDLYWIPAPA
jgi:hypothetical protein